MDEQTAIATLRAAGCVFAEDEAALLCAEDGDLAGMVGRRAAGEPLEQVVGWAAFCGLRITVERGVFVPRRRTEALALAVCDLARAGSTVVDLCCGSGAVAAVVVDRVPGAEVHAADRDAAAVRCAQRNLVGAAVHEGDLFAALPAALEGRVDVLAANVPYVPTAEIETLPAEARDHEPRATLDGGPDGLDVLRRVARAAGRWLAPSGRLLCETTAVQAPAAVALFATAAVHWDPEREVAVITATP